MSTISLCMIVKNEEENIAKCLNSIADLVDEVVLVDTGSIDKTKDIAKEYPNVVIYDFEWVNDFAKARNFAFSKATKDYQMWMDADEELIEVDRERFKQLRIAIDRDQPHRVTCYTMMLGHGGGSALRYRRNRIVRRDCNMQWEGVVHECLNTYGNCIDSDVEITHKRTHTQTDRNLKIFQLKESQGHEFSARDLTYYARELYWNYKYKESIEKFEEFLARDDVWIEDRLTSMKLCAMAYSAIGNKVKAKQMLISSFMIASPRAEFMYLLSNMFLEEGKRDEAIAWLQAITALDIPETYGFIEMSEWTWKPCLQLTRLMWEKGDIESSKKYHNMAYAYNQTDERILYNEALFGFPNRQD